MLAIIPQFLRPVHRLGIGEIGLNKNSRRNEIKVLEKHVNLAAEHDQLCILVHTPHLEDKLKGTRLIVDLIKSHKDIQPGRSVIIDHVEEHTVQLALDAGMWAGMTLYPESKCSPARATTWWKCTATNACGLIAPATGGVSDPLAVPKTALEMRKRGHKADAIDKLVYQNP